MYGILGVMHIMPIKTRILKPPKDNLFSALQDSLGKVPERSIIAVTSKVVSIGEGRCVAMESIEKDDLIKQEAEWYLPRMHVPGAFITHTIKHGMVVGSAGIDASNANGYYILWPKDPHASARLIHEWLTKTYGVSDVGVIITDSHSTPSHRGVVGIALGHYGFLPLRDYRGHDDIFGRPLSVTMANIPDGLAAAAVAVMGEGAETTPIALITDIPHVLFSDEQAKKEDVCPSFEVPFAEDTFAPFFKNIPWEKGGGF
jgi:dihydrofolate synthase / folylpolyglutamate synthase